MASKKTASTKKVYKASDFKVGEIVLGQTSSGSWIECKVKKVGPVATFVVTYDGWDANYDEDVTLDKLTLQNNTQVTNKAQVPIGTKVKVPYFGTMYDAKIKGHSTGLVLVQPKGYPDNMEFWLDQKTIKKTNRTGKVAEEQEKTDEDDQESSEKTDEEEEDEVAEGIKTYKVGDSVEVTGTKSAPWLPAKVVEVGPKRIFRVTYPGWSNVYDEYVSEVQCQLENGEQVTEKTEIKPGDALNCLWGDGTRYPGKVLHIDEGVIRVLKQGYPPGYETWTPASEIKELVLAKGNGADESLEAKIQSSVTSAMSEACEQSAQVKRSNEIPQKKIPTEKKKDFKESPKWKQMLSSSLLPSSVASKLKTLISKERKPPWSGKPIGSHEYHVSICACQEDQSFAECFSKILTKRGLKVTTDSEELHESRLFMVIYSDSSSRDENLVRHLTRAAERFNMAETIIIPVVRHYCTPEVLDHIPDNLAYSLSNTVMFNLDLFAEPLPMSLRSAVDAIEGVIRNYTEERQEYNISGLWLCQAIVNNELSGVSEIKEFTILMNQMGTQIFGKTVDGFQVKGELQGRLLQLRLTYRGEWSQNNIPWDEDDYCFVAEIVAVVHNNGYRLEGECCMVYDVADKGKKEKDRSLKETGLFNATLEKGGLSGFYNSHWYTDTSHEDSVAIVHRGGNELIVDTDGCFGVLNNGFYDPSTGTVIMNFADNRLSSQSVLGKLTKDSDGSTAIQCFVYGVESGMTSIPEACARTRDPMHYIKTKESDEDSMLMELYNIKPQRSLQIPFKPGSYSPLSSDEFAVVICCTKHEKAKASKLKELLGDVQEISPISVSYRDVAKGARTIVLLLSQHIQEEPMLIEVIRTAAEKETPIFNIGLDSWFNIFGEDKWRDLELREDLMNALARLNQTPDSTLDPNHSNFRGLVKGLRKHIDPPAFYLTGLWRVEIVNENPEEEIPRYSDLEDSSMQVVHKPSMLFLYFDHITNKLVMGTDYLVQNLEGSVDPETFTLTMKNAVGKYEVRINEEMDKMYGTYWSDRAQRQYFMLLTRSEGAISGIYRMGAEQYLTGIAQVGKSVASIMFGGYILPAMIDKNQIIFNAPVPLTPHTYVTYVEIHDDLIKIRFFGQIKARITLAPDGNYLSGFSFQSKLMEARNNFDAIQYTMTLQRVEKREGNDLFKSEKFVESSINQYWKTLEENDYEAFFEILSDDSKKSLTKESFAKQRLEHLRLEGKFIPGSLVFIGSKAQHQLGKPINATRYDFKMNFEKMKSADFSTMIEDKTKKLTMVTSYEEMAKTVHASQYDIMISYRSWDARFVDLLQAFLESKGFSVWRDRRMEVGVNWSEDITRAVRRSSCVLAAISENYLASVLCTKEVRMADDIGKPVIPLILPETEQKDDFKLKLVSSHYKGKTLPHTIAHELSLISWCDMRPEANLDIPDPVDVTSFEKKYKNVLDSVIRTVKEIVLHAKVLDLKGTWTLNVGSDQNQYTFSMVVVASDGSSVEGVLSSSRYDNVDIPIEKKKSWCYGSHIHLHGTLKRGQQSNTIIIEAKVASNGTELAGTLRFHDTPWEYPEGQPFNPLLAISYRSVKNDSSVYAVKGTRDKGFAQAASTSGQQEFLLDMERALGLVKDAFPNMTPEFLENSIVMWLKCFQKYDTDKNHSLDMAEVELALRVASSNVSEEERSRIITEMDIDSSGTVDFYEFLHFIARIKQNKISHNAATVKVLKKGFVSKMCSIQ